MPNLPEYKNLEEKSNFFQSDQGYVIENRRQLDDWYRYYTADVKREYPTQLIYRGSNEAKYKIYSSAQRLWIQEYLSQWRDHFSFKDFIIQLVNQAKEIPLIKDIFDTYDYGENERDFPILSLLQHYGAPTPVVDWTYDINKALYFAVDGVRKSGSNDPGKITNYMSVYLIDRRGRDNRELLSLLDIANNSSTYPSIESFREFGDEYLENANSLFTLSDFETTHDERFQGDLRVRTTKPLTSIFNQNIIAQKGLLMFNPFRDRPIEQLFNSSDGAQGSNLNLQPFQCFNIHKDLADYLRRKIHGDFQISKHTIYPNLYDQATSVRETVLNQLASSG
ncbi:MAG: FRG domain-containing protein [Bacteroidota bacterium]